MGRDEFLNGLDDILQLAPGTLKGPEKLEDLSGWDSMALIAFIAQAHTCGKTVSPRSIVGCSTIDDLLKLVDR